MPNVKQKLREIRRQKELVPVQELKTELTKKDKKIIDLNTTIHTLSGNLMLLKQQIREQEVNNKKLVQELGKALSMAKFELNNTISEEEVRLKELIKQEVSQNKPKDGKDYILTNEDKQTIANSIKVPVIEKEIKHSKETGKTIANKLNQHEKIVDYKVLKNIPELKRDIKKTLHRGGAKIGSQDSGTSVTNDAKIFNFGNNLDVSESGGVVTVDADLSSVTLNAENLTSSVDGTTKVFAVSGEPIMVVKDGTPMIAGVGYTYSSPNITITGRAPQKTLFIIY